MASCQFFPTPSQRSRCPAQPTIAPDRTTTKMTAGRRVGLPPTVDAGLSAVPIRLRVVEGDRASVPARVIAPARLDRTATQGGTELAMPAPVVPMGRVPVAATAVVPDRAALTVRVPTVATAVVRVPVVATATAPDRAARGPAGTAQVDRASSDGPMTGALVPTGALETPARFRHRRVARTTTIVPRPNPLGRRRSGSTRGLSSPGPSRSLGLVASADPSRSTPRTSLTWSAPSGPLGWKAGCRTQRRPTPLTATPMHVGSFRPSWRRCPIWLRVESCMA